MHTTQPNKICFISVLFQLHFVFLYSGSSAGRKGSWGWSNNWKFRLLSVLQEKNVICWHVRAACIFLKPANVWSPSHVHWGPPQQGSHGEMETGPMVASLEQRLVAPRRLLLPSVWMCLTLTKGWPWWYHNHSPLDFNFFVVRLNKYYKARMVFL